MIDKNDPRLIDYVLGEMSPEDKTAFEAFLKEPENAEALSAVREYQSVANAVSDTLSVENGESLRKEQRNTIYEHAEGSQRLASGSPVRRSFAIRNVLVPALAASLLATFAWMIITFSGLRGGMTHVTLTSAPVVDQVAHPISSPRPSLERQSNIAVYSAPPGERHAGAQDSEKAERDQEMQKRLPTEVTVLDALSPSVDGSSLFGQGELLRLEGGVEPAHRSSLTTSAEPTGSDSMSESALSRQWADNRMLVAPPMPKPIPPRDVERETYLPIVANAFLNVLTHPLSTFSIDVDTGAYTNVRRFLQQGQLPPADAVRIEEMVNYFQYDLTQPTGETPFSVTIEMAACPWAEGHTLARIALQGKTLVPEERKPANLVFLIDVSGSMSPPNRLPLAKEAMKALLNELEPSDRVAIVTYAGQAQVNLPSTPCTDKDRIRAAIDALQAGGGTHGSAGIQQAYRIAREQYIPGGVNRVLLATDGDFNVGTTSHEALVELIAQEAKSNVFLTVLGFGYGNLKDATLEQIANKGNGNYAYIDTFSEARRVLVEQLAGTLVTIAKDVKIQVEFNPQHVREYRLLGYENRALADWDFNNDEKDAGEIGAGHQVTALYQIVPQGAPRDMGVDPLRYQPAPEPKAQGAVNPEWMTIKLRYKAPEGDRSSLIELPWAPGGDDLHNATPDMRFASSVAAFGMLLRRSPYKGTADYDMVMALAQAGSAGKPERLAFFDLIVAAKTLMDR